MFASVRMLNQRRNLPEEFNQSIQFIQNVQSEYEEKQTDQIELLLNEALNKFRSLILNNHFHLMFLNNFIIKTFCLKFLQRIIQDQNNSEEFFKLKLRSYQILNDLSKWDFCTEKNLFRNDLTQQVYTEYFIQILEQLFDTLVTLNNQENQNNISYRTESECQSQSLPSQPPQPNSNSIFAPEPKENENIIILNKLFCIMFSCLPFEYLIQKNFLPFALDLFLKQDLNQNLSSQLLYAISNNICYSVKTSTSPDSYQFMRFNVDEKMKLSIHGECSKKTLFLMERNVRNEISRNYLKKALNNYCQYITTHKSNLENLKCAPKIDPISMTSYINSDAQNRVLEEQIIEWHEALYHIVINIVKILRMEFEAVNNTVEIDLVNYFYELLMTNIDNLTPGDAVNISNKLMPVLIKINLWRERDDTKLTFNQTQRDYLKYLSFKLADKFLTILQEEFYTEHWKSYKEVWLSAISEWYPMSYKMISSFCRQNRRVEFFETVNILAKNILDSWIENRDLPKNGSNCFCDIKPKKKYHSFLSEESVDAIVDLVHFYDFMIQNDSSYYKNFMIDIIPLLEIIRNLFNSIKTQKKLVLFNKFHCRLFQLHSPLLKTVGLWKDNIISMMLRLDNMTRSSLEFELSEEVFDTTLNCLKSATLCFGTSYLMNYKETIREALDYIKENSYVNYTVYHELDKVFY